MNTKKIDAMAYGGKIMGDVMDEVIAAVHPGVMELELDNLAEKLIRSRGGEPGFQKVKGYHHATCISTNNGVVHGIPGKRVLKEGDIVSIDCGVYYGGYHTDMAESVLISPKKETTKTFQAMHFLKAGKEALYAGILQAQPKNHVGNISQAIQVHVESPGYSVVRSLVGHGVGKELHEDPEIPGFLEGKIGRTPVLKPGMTIAVEVIYNMGGPDVVYEGGDDWSIVTADDSLAGLFERTIAITEEGPKILTARKGDPEELKFSLY